MKKLLGITGVAGSGKDTVAQILVEHAGYHRVALADALTLEVAHAILGYTPDAETLAATLQVLEEQKGHPVTASTGWVDGLLRFWGQMRRDMDGAEYWIGKLLLVPGIVVADVGHANEVAVLYAAGGEVWRVIRPGYESADHPSEQVYTLGANVEIVNDGTLADLAARVLAALEPA